MLSGVSYFSLLLRIDQDLAQQARVAGCSWCGGVLHRASYRRKSRGGPAGLGISLYPWFRSERPADVPLFERIGDTPVLITETGWPAEEHPEHPVPWQTSEAAQVTYVHRLFRMIEGRDVRGAVWAFLHPLLDDGDLVGRLFGSISLRDEDGAERPVYDVWAGK